MPQETLENALEVKRIEHCRICANPDLRPVMDLGVQALSGRFPKSGEPDPPRVPLQLVRCAGSEDQGNCGLLQLRHSVPPDKMFGPGYGYRSGVNETMRAHLIGIAQRIEQMVGLRSGDVVLDIGSNDATLLKGYKTKGLRRIGCEPAGKQFSKHYAGDIELVADYFNSSRYFSVSPKKPAKVVTSIAMLYDLESPLSFVEDISGVLARNGIWVFEQSYMPTMLGMNAFDTICHEHLEYYALRQIDRILKKCNISILDVEFNEINGGSFRVYACHARSAMASNRARVDSILAEEREAKLDQDPPYEEFKDRVFRMRHDLRRFLTAEKEKGKSIYVYGASTKGNVLLQFCGIGRDLVTAAADRSGEKWGRRTSGTGIPIVSEEEARKANPDYFLVLPWHFREEFIKREAEFLAHGGKFIFPLPKIEVFGPRGTDEN